jgi:hypothetical protein
MLREEYKLILDSTKVVVLKNSDVRARMPSQKYRLIGRLRLRTYPVLTYGLHCSDTIFSRSISTGKRRATCADVYSLKRK